MFFVYAISAIITYTSWYPYLTGQLKLCIKYINIFMKTFEPVTVQNRANILWSTEQSMFAVDAAFKTGSFWDSVLRFIRNFL